MANRDSSVMNVPPIFRCCKELALDICRKAINTNKEHRYIKSPSKTVVGYPEGEMDFVCSD